MNKKKRNFGLKEQGFYETLAEVKKTNEKDARMMPSGKGSFAGLPEEKVMKTWDIDKTYFKGSEYGDTKQAIDKQINQDRATLKKISRE